MCPWNSSVEKGQDHMMKNSPKTSPPLSVYEVELRTFHEGEAEMKKANDFICFLKSRCLSGPLKDS